jgi:hypothetical protein
VKQKNSVNKTTAPFIAALSLPFFSEMALANMSVYPMELNVDKSGAAQIKVASKTDDIQFIRVRQKKILNPGTPWKKRLMWPRGKKVALLSRRKNSPCGRRNARGSWYRLPPEKETTWRVYFEGVKQPDSIIPARQKALRDGKTGRQCDLGRPDPSRTGKSVVSLTIDPLRGTLKNNGTLRVPLRKIGICDADSSCRWIKEDATIYPDTERKLKTLTKVQGQKYKFRYFNWLNKSAEEADLPVVQ